MPIQCSPSRDTTHIAKCRSQPLISLKPQLSPGPFRARDQWSSRRLLSCYHEAKSSVFFNGTMNIYPVQLDKMQSKTILSTAEFLRLAHRHSMILYHFARRMQLYSLLGMYGKRFKILRTILVIYGVITCNKTRSSNGRGLLFARKLDQYLDIDCNIHCKY